MVERAASYGMDLLALTDRDGLSGAAKFTVACPQAGVRPILGVDLAVLPEQSESLTGRAGGCSVRPTWEWPRSAWRSSPTRDLPPAATPRRTPSGCSRWPPRWGFLRSWPTPCVSSSCATSTGSVPQRSSRTRRR
ncbi:MAG: PHP domain-containing protein [Actinomycetes bacterium]